MKLTKISLAAAVLVGLSAHAVEVSEFSGDARLYYGTADNGANDLFNKNGAYGDAVVSADLGLKFSNSVAGNFGVTYLTTMGLEGKLVNGVWAGDPAQDQFWLDEANIAFSVIDKTSMIVGRQYLDTPLVFSETWNIVSNSFDAAVLVDQHLPKTTLVGTWITRAWNSGAVIDANFAGQYDTFGDKGAFAFGAITELIPSVSAQLWYYDISSIATAFWAQAETELSGISLGAQFANLSPKIGDDTTAFAAKVGYSVDSFTVAAAFSQVSEDGTLSVINSAGLAGFGQSPLYTEAWWNFGYVGAPDTTSFSLLGETSMGRYDLGAYFTSANNDTGDMMDLTLTAGSSVGAFDYSFAYIMTDADNQNDADAYNTLQAYLTYNF